MAMEAWEKEQPDREALLRRLASKIMAEGNPERVDDLLELAACQATSAHWRRRALVAGMAEARPAKPIVLHARSAPLVKLSFSEDEKVRVPAAALLAAITWPGKAEREPEPERAAPLTAAEQARWERGRKQFTVSCAVCHSLSDAEPGRRCGNPSESRLWVA